MKPKGRVSTKGQLIIPAELRRRHGIESGTRVVFEDSHEGILIRPITSSAIREARGFLGKGVPADLEKEPDRKLE